MPLYDYRCLDCNTKFDVLIRDLNEEVVCKECGSKNVKRLISSFSFSSPGSTAVETGSSCSVCSSKNCSSCR